MVIWKDIKGYEGLYRISNMGNVLGIKSDKILKGNILNKSRGKKSIVVNLSKGGIVKTFLLSRLVYINFIGEIKGMIDHKDGNVTNNSIDNLYECEATFRRRKALCKRVLCTKTMKLYSSIAELEKELGLSRNYLPYLFRNNNGIYKHYKIID